MGQIKTCAKCNQSKKVTDFYSNKSMPMGVKAACKSCTKDADKRYRQKWYNKNKKKHYADVLRSQKERKAEVNALVDKHLVGKCCRLCHKSDKRLIAKYNGDSIKKIFKIEEVKRALLDADIICLSCVLQLGWDKRRKKKISGGEMASTG